LPQAPGSISPSEIFTGLTGSLFGDDQAYANSTTDAIAESTIKVM